MFVLRQLHNKINTTVISMSVICLMLFMTITALSSSIALKNSMQADLEKMTPVDLNLYKSANLSEKTVNSNGKEYKQKYNECKNGFIQISTSHTNDGIILVPDSCNFSEKEQKLWFLVANYNAKTDKEKEQIEKMLTSDESELVQKLNKENNTLYVENKISIIESSVGLSTIIVFIAIYLGVIFLIASCDLWMLFLSNIYRK